MSSKLGRPMRCSIFSLLPVKKLSMHSTCNWCSGWLCCCCEGGEAEQEILAQAQEAGTQRDSLSTSIQSKHSHSLPGLQGSHRGESPASKQAEEEEGRCSPRHLAFHAEAAATAGIMCKTGATLPHHEPSSACHKDPLAIGSGLDLVHCTRAGWNWRHVVGLY